MCVSLSHGNNDQKDAYCGSFENKDAVVYLRSTLCKLDTVYQVNWEFGSNSISEMFLFKSISGNAVPCRSLIEDPTHYIRITNDKYMYLRLAYDNCVQMQGIPKAHTFN